MHPAASTLPPHAERAGPSVNRQGQPTLVTVNAPPPAAAAASRARVWSYHHDLCVTACGLHRQNTPVVPVAAGQAAVCRNAAEQHDELNSILA